MTDAGPEAGLRREIESLRTELEDSRASERRTRADLEATSQRLQQITSVDPLTQTLSRLGFERALATELKRTRRSGVHPVAILLDCDNFKGVNQRFGHTVGDALLTEIAGRLQSTLRGSDYVSRVGVDEFLLLLPDTGYWEAVRIAERIRLRTSAPVGVGGRTPQAIETSLGVYTVPNVDMSLEEVLELAQAALAKSRAGRVRAQAAGGASGKGEGVVELLSIESTYRAVREPIISLATGAVTGSSCCPAPVSPASSNPTTFSGSRWPTTC